MRGPAEYGWPMRVARDPDEELRVLADRILRWVADGRGDVARGRNLFVLRFLDALWDPSSPLALPYRPTRNPAAFLVMAFDLVGDAGYGYLARLETAASRTDEVVEEIRRHVEERLTAPWPCFVEELRSLGLPNLAHVVDETVADTVRRPGVSDLPEELARVASWMTEEQMARFDVEGYVASLPMHRLLSLLRFAAADRAPVGREQHPTGGDLRALLRRRVDGAWCGAAQRVGGADLIGFLASWPIDASWMAGSPGEHDFAVAYALATDAPAPGRRWSTTTPYVRAGELGDFELQAARGHDAALERRATRLERWGVSAVFPKSVDDLDGRLAVRQGLEDFHAGGAWRQAVSGLGDALEVARRHFLQQVADMVAQEVAG